MTYKIKYFSTSSSTQQYRTKREEKKTLKNLDLLLKNFTLIHSKFFCTDGIYFSSLWLIPKCNIKKFLLQIKTKEKKVFMMKNFLKRKEIWFEFYVSIERKEGNTRAIDFYLISFHSNIFFIRQTPSMQSSVETKISIFSLSLTFYPAWRDNGWDWDKCKMLIRFFLSLFR